MERLIHSRLNKVTS
ncbi:hypothetical protein VCHENC02_0903A, partial [Vibrio harveyi]